MSKITVTSLTAERMFEIEQSSVIGGRIVGDDLVLRTKGGDEVIAGNVRGFKGRVGKTGNSFWTTTMPLTTDVTENVVPENIPDNEVQVGDLILSRSPSTMGYMAKVVSITPEDNATVLYLGNLRGPGGGSQEDFDWMFEPAIEGWANNTTMSSSEAVEGDVTDAKLLSANTLRQAVWSFVTGATSTAVSSIGKALNKAPDAPSARSVIGAASLDDMQSELSTKVNSDEVRDFKVMSRSQYNSLGSKDDSTIYFTWG